MTLSGRGLRVSIKPGVMVLLLTSCGGARADSTHAHDAAELAVAEPAEFSVYELGATWIDQQGATRTLSTLAGKPQVIALVYTSCALACPRIVADMKRLEGELGAVAADVGFVMVSIDPARDAPERLRQYAESTRLDAPRWTLLTSSDDAVQDLAVLLGVRYRRISEKELEHSNVLTVVDGAGRIVHRQVGLGTDPTVTVRVLAALASEHGHGQ